MVVYHKRQEKVSKNKTVTELNGRRFDASPGADRTANARQVAKAAQRPLQTSTTLMRHSVNKPAPSLSRQLRVSVPTNAGQAPRASVGPTPSSRSFERLKRAQTTARSENISRFQAAAPASTPSQQSKSEGQTIVVKRRPAQTALAPSPKTAADIFEQTIWQATGHLEKPPTKVMSNRRKFALIGGSLAAAIVMVGLVALQSLPSLRLQLASAKAGFNVGLPGYQAPGFHEANVTYKPGLIAIEYRSNSDSRTYTITEKNSAWDNQTLLNMYVNKITSSYATVSVSGRTVFIYGNAQATWVISGIWYQVQNNGALSQHELLELASTT